LIRQVTAQEDTVNLSIFSGKFMEVPFLLALLQELEQTLKIEP
jgi:hypothetical protein